MLTMFVMLIGSALTFSGIFVTVSQKLSEKGTFIMKLPLGIEIRSNKTTGLAIIGLGVILFFLALDFYRNGAVDSAGAALSTSVVSTAHAQPSPSGDSTASSMNRDSGWIYLGPAKDKTQWNFDLADNPVSTGVVAQARKNTPLRKDHFSNFNGTLIGKLLGIKEPILVATIEKNSCVRLRDSAKIFGVDKLWVPVEKTDCPT